MKFQLLGQVEAWSAGQVIDLGHARQRALLGVLLIEANQPVSADQLIERAWGDRQPRQPQNTLYSYLSRLRRVLTDAGGADLTRESGGYRLSVDEAAVDYHRFRELVRQARSISPAGGSAALFEQALDLWRGEPLDELDTAWAIGVRTRLEAERFAAQLDHAEAALDAGRHATVLPVLLERAAAWPLDERLAGQLLVALYRCGRQAEALERYERIRLRLAEQLGTDPSPALQRLHRQILSGDPALAAPPRPPPPPHPATAGATAGAGRTVGRPVSLLPADVADFIGRSKLLTSITETVTGTGAAGGPVPVVVLAGPAGVGKTTLAVRAAHRVATHFTGGQLYVDLRGADPRPADPRLVLGRFLRALGLDASAIPDDLDERAELYRSLLATRRVLVVLDNAAGAAQVKPLVPGVSSCAVIITARTRLAEVPGAELSDVDPVETEDGIALLARIAGPDRVGKDPGGAISIVRLCGNLPLAVRIAGARLARHPHWPLARLAERLRDQQRRLDELAVGDLDVRASFALSYQSLHPDVARALRLLATLDVQDFAAWVAGPLLGIEPDRAEEVVDGLVDCYLLDLVDGPGGPPRYRMHDLVRLFARERSAAEDSDAHRRAALARCFGAWLGLAERAHDRLPNRRLSPVAGRPPRPAVEELEHLIADPLGWFDSERNNLVAVVDQAAGSGLSDLAWDLAARCADFFDLRDLHDDWIHTHETALAACRRSGDLLGEAVALRGLGDRASLFPHPDVDTHLVGVARARETFRARGERSAETDALIVLAHLHRALGQARWAHPCLQAAAALAEGGVHPATQTILWLAHSFVEEDLGHHAESFDYARRSLKLAEAHGWRVQEADALQALGSVSERLNQTADGAGYLERALTITTELDHASMQAWVSCGVAGRYVALHRYRDAHIVLDRAAELFDRLDLAAGQASVLRWRGELATAEGKPRQAIGYLDSCLLLSHASQATYIEAYAHRALGAAYQAIGDQHAADAHRRRARDLLAGLGNEAEAGRVGQLLTAAPG